MPVVISPPAAVFKERESMKVTVLGFSNGLDCLDSSNTSLLVQTERTSIMVDVSSSPRQSLLRTGIDSLSLDAVLITHGHIDHVYAFPSLIHRMWLQNRTKPLLVVGNRLAIEVCKYFVLYFKLDKKIRFRIDWKDVTTNRIDGVETEHHFSDVSVNATLSEKTVSIVASGKLDDQDFTFSAKIDVQKIIAGENPFVEGPTTTPESLDILKKLEGAILTKAKGIKIAASGININLLFEATGCETKVPVKITVEGSLSISSNSSGHIVVRLDSPLKVKVDANQLGFGSISATVRGLLIEVNPATEYDLVSFSIQEIEISGQILQEMDNIRLKATMKELKIIRFEEDSTRLSIGSIEVSALGYQNISAALNIYNFSFIQRLSSATEVLPFDFGVAISFENQKLGLRGLFLSSTPTIEIAVLNDVPVNQESLIAFLVELLKGGGSGTV